MKTKKITEKLLLDNFIGVTAGLTLISDVKINGKRFVIYWSYYANYNRVFDRSIASDIFLCWDREGYIELDNNCDQHPSIEAIKEHVACAVGTLLPE